mgnify:CR=1 FL=1
MKIKMGMEYVNVKINIDHHEDNKKESNYS